MAVDAPLTNCVAMIRCNGDFPFHVIKQHFYGVKDGSVQIS
ncbi:hypothetical protein SAMN05443636_0002 [Halobaculum gomorrense]|uniref:Uncharacterized protein n=1 Tax=Halobaculum gomorrense TaxID=43928 RepID=A0A1M5J9W5_9EURY|nr:hypothetical protein SAMN05443636_0002 [Halobaculum gomorrense]